jgi:hypothetical protein
MNLHNRLGTAKDLLSLIAGQTLVYCFNYQLFMFIKAFYS